MLSILIVVSSTAGMELSAYAQTIFGSQSENVSWELNNDTGELVVSGTGYVDAFNDELDKALVTGVIINEGIEGVNDNVFNDFSCIESVSLPLSLKYIGVSAFNDSLSYATYAGSKIDFSNIDLSNSNDSLLGCIEYQEEDYLFDDKYITINENSLFSEYDLFFVPNKTCRYAPIIENDYYDNCSYSIFLVDEEANTQEEVLSTNLYTDDGQNKTCYDLYAGEKYKIVLEYNDGQQLLIKMSERIPISIDYMDVINVTDSISYYYEDEDSIVITGIGSIDRNIANDICYFIGYQNIIDENDKLHIFVDSQIETIEDDAFSDYSNIESVQFAEGVSSIGDRAFVSNFNLINVVIPDSIKYIGEDAFNHLYGIYDVDKYPISLDSGFVKDRSIVFLGDNQDAVFSDCILGIDYTIYAYEGSKAEEYALSQQIWQYYSVPRPKDNSETEDITGYIGICGETTFYTVTTYNSYLSNSMEHIIFHGKGNIDNEYLGYFSGNETDGYNYSIDSQGYWHASNEWESIIGFDDATKYIVCKNGITQIDEFIFNNADNTNIFSVINSRCRIFSYPTEGSSMLLGNQCDFIGKPNSTLEELAAYTNNNFYSDSSILLAYTLSNSVGETFTFGMYPQTKVDDENTISQLENELENQGSEMTTICKPFDYTNSVERTAVTKYVDVLFEGNLYRKITREFTDSNESTESNWFKWESIEWQYIKIRDSETILAIAKKSLDVHIYDCDLVDNGRASIDNWLMSSFKEDAFPDSKKTYINSLSSIDTSVFIQDDSYGNTTANMLSLIKIGGLSCTSTDYAKALGIYCHAYDDLYGTQIPICQENEYTDSPFWTNDGQICGCNEYRNNIDVSSNVYDYEDVGVRPYICLSYEAFNDYNESCYFDANIQDDYGDIIFEKGTNHNFVRTDNSTELEGQEGVIATYECTNCGQSYTQIINEDTHYYACTTIEPTCTEKGYNEYVCYFCGDSYTDEAIPPTDHNYVNGVCTVCGQEDANAFKTGSCGENVTYKLNRVTGELVISGYGDMYNRVDIYDYPDEIFSKEDKELINTIIIENGVTSISDALFWNFSSVTNIQISESVTTIPYRAFLKCNSLETFVVDESNPKYASREDVLFDKESFAIVCYPPAKQNETYFIPEDVKEIGIGAFCGCSYLRSVVVPEGVESIILGFAYAQSIESINVDSNNMHYTSQDGILYDKDMTSLIQYPLSKEIYSLSIPDGVVSILDYAFAECYSLASISIPNSVTSISEYAFDNCCGLTDVYYSCTQEDWSNINIGIGNECLTSANLHFHEHVYTSVVTPPTCTEQGYTTYICDSCDYSYVGDYVDPCHTIVIDEAVSPTCTNDGLTEGSHCSACDEVIVVQETVEALGHDYHLDKNYATCTNAGFAIYICSRCADLKAEEVEALGHDYVATVVPPTCISEGYTAHICSRCNDTYSDNYVPIVDHSFGEYVYNNDGTCLSDGTKSAVCSMCGEVSTIVAENTKTDHTYGEYIYNNDATCTADGTKSRICSVCGKTETITAEGTMTEHDYEIAMDSATCTESGYIVKKCKNCSNLLPEVSPIKPHQYSVIEHKDSTPDEQGYDLFKCDNCDDNYKELLPYAADNSALIAVILMATKFDEADYSSESFSEFQAMYEACTALVDANVSQSEIDAAITNIITAMTSLVPYADITVFSKYANPTVMYNGEVYSDATPSILYGTEVTVSAPEIDGYKFDSWFDTMSKRTLSTDSEYTFFVSTNLVLEAKYVPVTSATLTFANESGQISSTVTQTTDEWNNFETLDSILPNVPYSYGHVNGRWDYDNDEVLSKLQAGEDVTIIAVYDVDREIEQNTPENDSEFVPVGNLTFDHNWEYMKGSFIMNINIPEKCRVNSIGIAFYYGNKNSFDPTQMILTLNNKSTVSQFNTSCLDDVYIVNTTTDSHNWAAVGYVTYFDEEGKLVTYYTNQVNVVNNEWIK
ncbi:MAG: leucine-rich repeat protein [Eubacterium sp.]